MKTRELSLRIKNHVIGKKNALQKRKNLNSTLLSKTLIIFKLNFHQNAGRIDKEFNEWVVTKEMHSFTYLFVTPLKYPSVSGTVDSVRLQ